jgi:hypothetical protein
VIHPTHVVHTTAYVRVVLVLVLVLMLVVVVHVMWLMMT